MLQEMHCYLSILPDRDIKIQKCDSDTFPEVKCLFQASKTSTVKN